MERPMPKVELIYDADCPNAAAARAALMHAFVEAGVAPRWSEHLSDEAPEHARGLGSPTILVDGRDVAGPSEGPRSCCRVYATADGALAPVPEVAVVARALRESARVDDGTRSGAWRSSVSAVPAVLTALLPKVACPACWPAYAGALGSLGVPFLMETSVLLPLTATFLVGALGMLAFRARRRCGCGPFALGLIASAAILIGKFAFDLDAVMYAGVALLMGASLWNAWPKRRVAACPACPPAHA